MNASAKHWDEVYRQKAADQVSWYRSHLETSLRLLTYALPSTDAAIIDVGAGHSRLADDLILAGYRNLTLLDLSLAALEQTRSRLGVDADPIQWIEGDVTQIDLPVNAFDAWHDRAVFHFLTTESQQRAYVSQLERSVRVGGHLVLATFGPNGPVKCSNLDVARYDASALARVLGRRFELLESFLELHETPSGSAQEFQYTWFRKIK